MQFDEKINENMNFMNPKIAKWYQMSYIYFLEVLSENVHLNMHLNEEKNQIISKQENFTHFLVMSDKIQGHMNFFGWVMN